MASYMLQAMATPLLSKQQIRQFTAPLRLRVKCKAKGDTSSNSSLKIQRKDRTERNNVVLKIAWYASELFGMATAVLQPSQTTTAPVVEYQELIGDASGRIERDVVVAAIIQDFQSSYIVTGNVTVEAYEEDWEDLADKGIAHWRFSFVLSLPWTPLLSATGCTEFHFDAESGKVCRHIEKRDVPITILFKQILMPRRYNYSEGESKLTVEVATEMAARAVTKCN
ncbi:uncharacterized protein LOC141605082 isoform X2 [Silene latifolia]|uniref:uncharacterized protein LOC141605082 isoform X2 n=1 Tax=Silene latifolia TaxID=37657 RepID=UPI003D76A8F7